MGDVFDALFGSEASQETASVSATTLPPPTESELAAENIALSLAREQLRATRASTNLLLQQAELTGPLIQQLFAENEAFNAAVPLEDRIALQQEEFERSRRLGTISEEILELELERIRQGDRATPEQLELIDEQIAAAQAQGESDISRFSQEELRQLKEEFALSAGLRPEDSPIIDRGGEIIEESLRQQGQLTRELAGTRASAALNFPLAAGQIASQRSQFQQGLAASARDFTATLRDQAFNNRLRLLGGQAQLGLGLSATGPALGLLGTLQRPRLAQTTTAGNVGTTFFETPSPFQIGLDIFEAIESSNP